MIVVALYPSSDNGPGEYGLAEVCNGMSWWYTATSDGEFCDAC